MKLPFGSMEDQAVAHSKDFSRRMGCGPGNQGLLPPLSILTHVRDLLIFEENCTNNRL
jgi:hypothetical protein